MTDFSKASKRLTLSNTTQGTQCVVKGTPAIQRLGETRFQHY